MKIAVTGMAYPHQNFSKDFLGTSGKGRANILIQPDKVLLLGTKSVAYRPKFRMSMGLPPTRMLVY
jgi:hypothetical protein